ncbi:MAG: hypothetical protein KGJ06_08670 [Pseudomonadota bacterium]|nr:hypothetical protein [Pseudomonadota bacterium]
MVRDPAYEDIGHQMHRALQDIRDTVEFYNNRSLPRTAESACRYFRNALPAVAFAMCSRLPSRLPPRLEDAVEKYMRDSRSMTAIRNLIGAYQVSKAENPDLELDMGPLYKVVAAVSRFCELAEQCRQR